MAKKLSFFILMMLLFLSSIAKARPITSTISPSSSLIEPLASSSTEELSSQDEGGCEGLGREECLVRRTLVAHTDYIYTQDIKGP